MKKVIVQPRQNLWDIAVQHCGTADAAFGIAAAEGCIPSSTPIVGTEVGVPEPMNKKVVAHYVSHGIVPATGEGKW